MNYALWVQHITTPYLPVVGLVHPDCIQPETLRAVVKSLETGVRPPFDKSNRWGREHPERLADEWYLQQKDATLIMTTRNDVVTPYIFASSQTALDAMLAEVRARSCNKVYTFMPASNLADAHITHAFLGKTKSQSSDDSHVRTLTGASAEVEALTALDDGQEMAGLAFLASQIAAGSDLGPTLGYFVDGKLAGAIGPLGVMTDAEGRTFLMPPYFGVQAQLRGTGVGRALWQAAMSKAATQGAVYVMVQAEDSAASREFYARSGMQNLGATYLYRLDSAK